MSREDKQIILRLHLNQLRANQRALVQTERRMGIVSDDLLESTLALASSEVRQIDGRNLETELRSEVLNITFLAKGCAQGVVTIDKLLKRLLELGFVHGSAHVQREGLVIAAGSFGAELIGEPHFEL